MIRFMKTASSIMLIVFCLLSPLYHLEGTAFAQAEPKPLIVDSRGLASQYKTIQEAINAANATTGYTILVLNGTYYENIVVNKSISLIGESRDFTIVDGRQLFNVIHIEADNVTIRNFNVRNGGITYRNNSAIRIDHSDGCVVNNNKLVDSYEGVSIISSSDNVIVDNIMSDNYDGVSISSTSSDNTISNNTILNSYNGVGIYASNNNTVSNNRISNSYDGIGIYNSNTNIISENTVTDNYDGIGIYTSNDNLVFDNIIESNSYDGVVLAFGSMNNVFYHNNFVNRNQVTSSGSTNTWDQDHEGNYWGIDYNGTDLNEDGIGDTSYLIDTENRDNYPLVGMFFSFRVMLREQAYEVDVVSNSTISGFQFEIGTETGNRIIHFNAVGTEGNSGFCRVKIPSSSMNYPFILLIGGEEATLESLTGIGTENTYLYFTYVHSNRTISIISSKSMYLYDQLLRRYLQLQADLNNQNSSYNNLLYIYNSLLYDFSSFLADYDQLGESYDELNASFHEHLLIYSENVENIRNLMYIFAATTAIFLITTVYLSKRVHGKITT